MLRLRWRSTAAPARLLSEEDFIREFEPLAASGFAGAPPGPVLVEGLDEQQRVAWTGHYRTAAGLTALLRQLVEERDKGLCGAALAAGAER